MSIEIRPELSSFEMVMDGSTPMDIDPNRLPTDGMKRGGGWSVITGWGRATLSRSGKKLWQTLNHKSACLSCAWGTGVAERWLSR